ncbi:MAG: hypothetical protein H6737_08190 [Alphaproteobacteria bacterium]|nr:hypothetical protein [Alphaproteobacteria bacterium]
MSSAVSAPKGDDDDHLQMVPLSAQSDGTYDDGKRPGSSTEFFAIPHANRQKSDGPPAAAGRAPPAAPPMAAPMPVQHAVGPMPVGPPPVVGIQGPMSGPVGGNPYNIAPPNPDEGRTQSYRVFGVVIALVLMVCVALVVTVLLVVVAVINANQPEPLPEIVNEAPLRPQVPIDADTGGAGVGGPKPIKPSTPKPTVPKPTGPKPPPKPKAEPEESNGGGPAGAPGRLQITVPSDVRVTYFEASCPSGYRNRGKFVGTTAALDDVPAEDCKVSFKGGTISTTFTARPGKSYNCTALSTSQLACK